MDSRKSQLVVTMTNVEFAKPFHYFLTVQLDGEGEKVKTQLSLQETHFLLS